MVRRAFSLVELLVVIAIIGMLVASLIPAVQSARAAARRAQCSNHEKQISLGVIQFANQADRLPAIINDELPWTDRPRNRRDRYDVVSWRLDVLPHLEEQRLYDVFSQKNWSVYRPDPGEDHSWRTEKIAERVADVPVFHCPSEDGGPAIDLTYILRDREEVIFDGLGMEANFAPHTIPASMDVVVTYSTLKSPFPIEGAPDSIQIPNNINTNTIQAGAEAAWYGRRYWRDKKSRSESVFGRDDEPLAHSAKLSYITDGLSKTILVHETFRSGNGRGVGRNPNWFLIEDAIEYVSAFGRTERPRSHHKNGQHAAMADGSVRFLNSNIDRATYLSLLGRQDAGRFR